LWVRGTEGGFKSLRDEAEKVQYTILAKQLIDQFQTHHYQYERGLIEGEIWDTWKAQFEDHVVTWPGLREVLVQRRKNAESTYDHHLVDLLITICPQMTPDKTLQ
jgi:hypothetical protein